MVLRDWFLRWLLQPNLCEAGGLVLLPCVPPAVRGQTSQVSQ
jgi:hypothetical protein